MPIEPDPCVWAFPPASSAGPDEVVALGADLAPGTLLAAYRAGLFPMPVPEAPAMVWWSPDPRGVIPLDAFHLSRSLRRTRKRYEITVDRAFGPVVEGCADPTRPGAWITPDVRAAYTVLHALGWAHSVEAWAADGTLAGGLYGVEIGGLVAAESKFHVGTDASKAAVAGLVERLRERGGPRLLDVQWTTGHLRTLGAVDVPRREYLRRLAAALPLPPALG
jgi:leucyl/phenylalanyl-tRNA---protein transferase